MRGPELIWHHEEAWVDLASWRTLTWFGINEGAWVNLALWGKPELIWNHEGPWVDLKSWGSLSWCDIMRGSLSWFGIKREPELIWHHEGARVDLASWGSLSWFGIMREPKLTWPREDSWFHLASWGTPSLFYLISQQTQHICITFIKCFVFGGMDTMRLCRWIRGLGHIAGQIRKRDLWSEESREHAWSQDLGLTIWVPVDPKSGKYSIYHYWYFFCCLAREMKPVKCFKN